MKRENIWRFETSSRKYLSVSPDDLDDLKGIFCGVNIANNWKPPAIHILGKSKKIGDFIGWSGAPLVTKKARNALEPILGGYAQFLPFHAIKNKEIFVMNVIRVEHDFLDIAKSKILYVGPEPQSPVALHIAIFKPQLPKVLPPIFKVIMPPDEVSSEIFVTTAFADIVIEHQLTGIELADPSVHSLKATLTGKSQNVVQGVPD